MIFKKSKVFFIIIIRNKVIDTGIYSSYERKFKLFNDGRRALKLIDYVTSQQIRMVEFKGFQVLDCCQNSSWFCGLSASSDIWWEQQTTVVYWDHYAPHVSNVYIRFVITSAWSDDQFKVDKYATQLHLGARTLFGAWHDMSWQISKPAVVPRLCWDKWLWLQLLCGVALTFKLSHNLVCLTLHEISKNLCCDLSARSWR